MACSRSPEPDRYHRFRLAATGATFQTACVYCGQAKTLRPFVEQDDLQQRRTLVLEPSAAKRAQPNAWR